MLFAIVIVLPVTPRSGGDGSKVFCFGNKPNRFAIPAIAFAKTSLLAHEMGRIYVTQRHECAAIDIRSRVLDTPEEVLVSNGVLKAHPIDGYVQELGFYLMVDESDKDAEEALQFIIDVCEP